ncbi:glycosyltransferase family 2 protein [Altibacter sp. HG106]|uniref:glycosyltransferase family 2 protein n=1 Tax=Altibacter sp. HG106 TaxID=3023937 RepID=UPI00234FF910|nr:glycosyltransferase family 2 protein [Altibacter sp. HG106]MDC7993865.1 glycosyltransferase family 2 protein [Altibacter sp. HG106]
MNIAIVILNWNGKALLKQFLPSVVTYSEEASIYVADNASTDDSVNYIKTHFPSISILQNSSNKGYAGGYNEALRSLKEEVFVLLNSDVAVTQDWLAPIEKAFTQDATLAAAQPKIKDVNRPEYFEYAGAAGGYIDQLGYPFCRGRIFTTIEKDTGQYDDAVSIFWASGACLAVRRDDFLHLGGFDEDLFAHQEEIDLCWRLQLQGKTIRYLPESTVFHVGGATLATQNTAKTFYNFRNSLLVLVKNHPKKRVIFLLFIRLLLDALAGLQFLSQGNPSHFVAIIRAHLSFYALFPKFWKKRTSHTHSFRYYRCKSVVWKYYFQKKRLFNNGY